MSIRQEIGYRLQEGRLFNLAPVMPDDPVKRTLLVSDEINAMLEGPWASKAAQIRFSRLRADLEAFVKGEPISVCLEPFKARDAYMARLDKPQDEVWDIRSRDPRPGLRLLGRFAEQDVFVAFSCWPRSKHIDFLDRPPLLDQKSDEWRLAVLECQSEWRKLFSTYPAFMGSIVDDYISENFIIV